MNNDRDAMRLKARINSFAKEQNIPSQVVLQNFMIERFLERLSKSAYQNNFIIKGGILVSSIVGLATRATMDLDTTIRDMKLSEEKILSATKEICEIDAGDEVTFSNFSVSQIRKDDFYGGLRIRLDSNFHSIVTPLSIDISTGDVITPHPVKFSFPAIFSEKSEINLYAYNIETVLAEKTESILKRGITNTRPRDFYDVHILSDEKKFDAKLFQDALYATAKHRGTEKILEDILPRLSEIKESTELSSFWEKYKKKFSYAKDIEFSALTKSLETLLLPIIQKEQVKSLKTSAKPLKSEFDMDAAMKEIEDEKNRQAPSQSKSKDDDNHPEIQ